MTTKLQQTSTERRAGPRLVRRQAVRVRTRPGAAELAAQTRDVSATGIFLYTESRMVAGANVDLVLILPPELTSGEKCWVCCHAKVVRVEERSDHGFGVAAAIERMEMLPEMAI